MRERRTDTINAPEVRARRLDARGAGTAGTANRFESINFGAECADKYIIECKGVSVYG